MQLFLTLNDLAGRIPLLDAFMRGVYIATIPLLAVILLGLLVLAPRVRNAPSRGKVALATVVALGGAALLMWGIDVWAQSLNVGTLSPRPFMTRWVNLLIVEPQDNSFPCVEVIIATIFSVGIWAAQRWWGVFAALATLLLMTARLFCGSNYGADVGVAALVGVGLMPISLALCRAPRTRDWRTGLAGLGAFTLGATALATFFVMASMPRFAGKMQLPWGIETPGTTEIIMEGAPTAARNNLQEGEGMPTLGMNNDGSIKADEYAGEAEALALSKRATLFLPKVEAALTQVLAPKAAPFRLVDVEVAPVNFKDGSYRAAALRFEIDPKIPNVRQLVAQRAATLVKAAFAADAQLDNVDITAIVIGARTSDSLMRFAGDEVPVFTASIQRRNLVLKAPRWANAPNLEGGLWLRTRSRLWIDEKILPKTPAVPQPTATPRPAATPPAIAAPGATASPKPTIKAQPTTRPTVQATVKPQARPTIQPKLRPTIKPQARPRARPTIQAKPTRVPKSQLSRETV